MPRRRAEGVRVVEAQVVGVLEARGLEEAVGEVGGLREALGEGEVLMPVDDRSAVGKATQGHFDGLMRWVVCRTAPPPATPPALIRPLSQWATGWLRTLALGEFERLHPLGAPSRLTSPLPYQIARSFHEEGDSKAALPYYRQALAACEALRLPQENSAVRAAVGAYALCLQAAGMYGDAAPLLNQSLQWLKGERGEFDTTTKS